MILTGVYTQIVTDEISVPIYKTSTLRPMVSVYSIALQEADGAHVLITAQCEITNPYEYNVGLGMRIVGRCPGYTSAWVVCAAAMENITPSEHHSIRSFAVWDRPSVPAPIYVLEAYAAASKVKSGDRLKIEPGCGQMQCAVFGIKENTP